MDKKVNTRRYYLRLKYIKHTLKCKFNNEIWYKKKVNYRKKRIYIFLSCDYGNLGDIAISFAQYKLLNETYFNEYDVIEVPISQTYNEIPKIKKEIKKDDIITIIGGGNMGNSYEWIEEARRIVILTFKNNKIISFPQTIDFDNSLEGAESLRRTRKIYSKHKQLYIFAREKMSYERMKKIFAMKNIYMMPDIVFSLKQHEVINKEKKHIGICFRNDIEKDRSNDLVKKIEDKFLNYNIEYFDTHIGDDNINNDNKYSVLREFLNKISSYKLVITDRLHGMIFCYITNTPCIVLDNSNHKISSTYKTWLNNCDFIKLIEKNEEVINIDSLFRLNDFSHDLNKEFLEIKKLI